MADQTTKPPDGAEETTGLIDSSELNLRELWTTFTRDRSRFTYSTLLQAEFLAHLRALVSDPDAIDDVRFCDGCHVPEWNDDLSAAGDDDTCLCTACWDTWADCASCENRYHPDDLYRTLDGNSVCSGCRNDYYTYCEDCDGYYHDEDAGDHDHNNYGCDCAPPLLAFTVRNDGGAPLANDTRVTLTLPAGTIDAEGLDEIASYLRRQNSTYRLSYDLAGLGSAWQTSRGNYTKRLSSLAAKNHQVKLTPEILSQVGCIARDHSKAVSVAVEVTRNLNLPPGDFANEGSCWWGGSDYGQSRCALKTNGGFGLRTFSTDRYGYGGVTGRAWVLPLRRSKDGMTPQFSRPVPPVLTPTFDALTPDAFVVFNGYGDLNGWAAPRIAALMAGWTYRRIGFTCDPMYVNSHAGYLIAPEELASRYTNGQLELDVPQHATLFYDEQAEKTAKAEALAATEKETAHVG